MIAKFIVLILLSANLSLKAMENNQKHIVVEPLFFIEHDSLAISKQLSWGAFGNIFRNMISSAYNGSLDMIPEFFNVLRTINPQEPPYPIVWENHTAPYLLYQYLIAQQTPEEIIKKVAEGINKQKANNTRLMHDFAKLTFDPATNTAIMKTIASSLAFLKELKKHGNTLHLVGNWNDKAAEKLQARFSEEFSLFDQIILSGKEKKIQSPALYQKFFEQSNISPDNTIFILTSETRDLLPKETKNLQTLMCKKKDLGSLRKKLLELNVISE